ncbi:MAG TPA: hypothetical protein VLT33_19760 [Labilithrix sp.]|nr:hypothetical protein [Labilithrix sp.]
MIELVVLGATLAIAVGASGAQVRRRILAARSLERYASWRSHVFVPAVRGKESPRVEGTKGDVAFTVDLVRISGHLRTRVRAPVTKGPGARIAIVQRGTLGRALRSRADGETRVGIDAFDDAYRLHGMASDEALVWLGESLAHLVILDERRDVWLGSDGATVTLAWGGVEMNPLLIDAARDLVVSLASWHRPELPYR